MTIAWLRLDDIIVIPDGLRTGDISRADLSECVFRAVDGWTIVEVAPGRFELRADWMIDGPVTIGGYGYTYGLAPEAAAPALAVAGKGRRH